jgi:hypothetical protein
MIERDVVPASSTATVSAPGNSYGSRQHSGNGGQTGMSTDGARAAAFYPLQAFHNADRMDF